MTPEQANGWLESLSQLGMRFGLSRMQRALEALGHPERRLRVLHVAGTNGKGSTCAFAAAACACAICVRHAASPKSSLLGVWESPKRRLARSNAATTRASRLWSGM